MAVWQKHHTEQANHVLPPMCENCDVVNKLQPLTGCDKLTLTLCFDLLFC